MLERGEDIIPIDPAISFHSKSDMEQKKHYMNPYLLQGVVNGKIGTSAHFRVSDYTKAIYIVCYFPHRRDRTDFKSAEAEFFMLQSVV